jgi:preprotein translocase subunit SecG
MTNVLLTAVLAVQMLAALAMIGLILIQHGKGADMGAAFGSGASGSLFGASGSANFLSRTTAVLAGVFFICTLALAYFSNLSAPPSSSVLERAVVAPPAAPAASGAAQIPGSGAPAPASGTATPATPAPAAPAASGAAQIPAK